MWKQFRALVEFLDRVGMPVSLRDEHWRGYVKYALAETQVVPQPGQLCNPILVKRYLKSSPRLPYVPRTERDLDVLYSRVLRPEFRNASMMRRRLHLETAPEDE